MGNVVEKRRQKRAAAKDAKTEALKASALTQQLKQADLNQKLAAVKSGITLSQVNAADAKTIAQVDPSAYASMIAAQQATTGGVSTLKATGVGGLLNTIGNIFGGGGSSAPSVAGDAGMIGVANPMASNSTLGSLTSNRWFTIGVPVAVGALVLLFVLKKKKGGRRYGRR